MSLISFFKSRERGKPTGAFQRVPSFNRAPKKFIPLSSVFTINKEVSTVLGEVENTILIGFLLGHLLVSLNVRTNCIYLHELILTMNSFRIRPFNSPIILDHACSKFNLSACNVDLFFVEEKNDSNNDSICLTLISYDDSEESEESDAESRSSHQSEFRIFYLNKLNNYNPINVLLNDDIIGTDDSFNVYRVFPTSSDTSILEGISHQIVLKTARSLKFFFVNSNKNVISSKERNFAFLSNCKPSIKSFTCAEENEDGRLKTFRSINTDNDIDIDIDMDSVGKSWYWCGCGCEANMGVGVDATEVLQVRFDADIFAAILLASYYKNANLILTDFECDIIWCSESGFDCLCVLTMSLKAPSTSTSTSTTKITNISCILSFCPWIGEITPLKFANLDMFCLVNNIDYNRFISTQRISSELKLKTKYYISKLNAFNPSMTFQKERFDYGRIQMIHSQSLEVINHPFLPISIINDEDLS